MAESLRTVITQKLVVPSSLRHIQHKSRVFHADSSVSANTPLRFSFGADMREWLRNVFTTVMTVVRGMVITLKTWFGTYGRRTFTEAYEYPEMPAQVKPRYRGFHRFDLTTCIGCEKCAVACPVDCIYIEKEKSPVGKGFRVDTFVIDYTKCMFCALCVDPCPVDCIFMGSNFDLSCYERDGCVVDFAKLPLQVAWGKATLNPTAVAESKVLHEPVWVKGEPSPFEFAESK